VCSHPAAATINKPAVQDLPAVNGADAALPLVGSVPEPPRSYDLSVVCNLNGPGAGASSREPWWRGQRRAESVALSPGFGPVSNWLPERTALRESLVAPMPTHRPV
jgi:hypothetical protein